MEPIKEQTRCEKPCGENHCDTNGGVNRKRHLVEEQTPDQKLKTHLDELYSKSNPLIKQEVYFAIKSEASRKYWEAQRPIAIATEDFICFQRWWGMLPYHRRDESVEKLYAEFKSKS